MCRELRTDCQEALAILTVAWGEEWRDIAHARNHHDSRCEQCRRGVAATVVGEAPSWLTDVAAMPC